MRSVHSTASGAGPSLPMAAAIALACLASGCGMPRLEATYRVAIADPPSAHAEVTARYSRLRGDSLSLTGLGDAALLNLEVLDAQAAGRRVPWRTWTEATTTGSDDAALPRVTIPVGGRSDVVVRYRVGLGRAGGNAHVGHTGVREGYCGNDFALVSGRNLFLLPRDAARLGDVRVRFDLPSGWTAVTPWSKDGDVHRPGVAGRLQAEHLVTAAIGLGRFRTVSTRVGGTEHRFAFEQSIPDSSVAVARGAMIEVADYCRTLFRRDLGPAFETVLVPEVEGGDEVQVESWGSGQGITAYPFTASTLHRFALGLLRAYMQHEPWRSEVSGRRDYWLASAVPEYFAWKALVHAGWLDAAELRRELGVAYLGAIRLRGVEADLERLYDTHLKSRPGRTALGPFMLEAMDREVRRRSAGRTTLESVVASAFPAGRAASLWSRLPGGEAQWRHFRSRHVRGTEPLPVAELVRMDPARERPQRAVGTPVRRLTLLVSGGTFGFLETCGCKSNESGGAARRATLMRRLRAEHPDLVWLDAGDTFTRAETGEVPDSLERAEQRLHLGLLTEGGCRVSTVGSTELQFGVPFFRSIAPAAGFSYLSANVSDAGRPLGPSHRIIEAAGLRLGVIGVFDPPTPMAGASRLQRNVARLTVEDPVKVLQREAARLRPGVDLVVAIGRMTPLTMRRIAREVPELDVAISTDNAGPNAGGGVTGPAAREDPSGFHGSLLCLYTAPLNYGLVSAGLGLDDSLHIATVDFQVHMLTPDVPDDPEVRATLDRFYDAIGRTTSANTLPPFAGDRERMEGRYVGSDRCATCHRDAWDQWRTTPHADAFKTLLERHRNANPKCVGCHVVGFEARHGYALGDPEKPLGGVQCETCHGPGAEHAERPTRESIRRQVGEAVCLECHTPEHSERFDYAARLPRVTHAPEVSRHGSERREPPGLGAAATAILAFVRGKAATAPPSHPAGRRTP